MDRHQRFALLTEEATGDRELGLPGRPRFNEGPVGIRKVRLPGGGVTKLMRVMQTNACSLSCGYCPTFCGGKVRRVALSPEETARTFMEAHRAGMAEGLFLTSGVPGRPQRAMDRMLATVDSCPAPTRARCARPLSSPVVSRSTSKDRATPW